MLGEAPTIYFFNSRQKINIPYRNEYMLTLFISVKIYSSAYTI